jgi:carbonic anhydrase
MHVLQHLFDNNRRWAQRIKQQDPEFFNKLAHQQNPEYLWIGCADSRVPANEIVGMLPGDLFVHRNVANVVVHSDMNCLSVLQYAVDILKVKHIIVCGHFGCGGVGAALQNRELGLIDNWLRIIKDIAQANQEELSALPDHQARVNRLCELNVMQQVANVCHTTIVQRAWAQGRELRVHGWIYSVADGILKDLRIAVKGQTQIPELYRMDL